MAVILMFNRGISDSEIYLRKLPIEIISESVGDLDVFISGYRSSAFVYVAGLNN